MTTSNKRLLSPIKIFNEFVSLKKPKTFSEEFLPKKVEKLPAASNYDFLFDDSSDFDLEALDTAENVRKAPKLDLSNWQRCIVEQVERCEHDLVLRLKEDEAIDARQEQIDKENEANGSGHSTTLPAVATCHLQGPWCMTKLAVGDIVSIKAVWDDNLEAYKVDVNNGFCITNPDALIPGTTVVGSLFCKRKAVLQEKFRGVDANSRVMVIGSLVHELLQVVLAKRLTTPEDIQKMAFELLNSHEIAYTLYSSSMTREETKEEVEKFIPNVVDFVRQYILGKTPPIIPKDSFQGCIAEIQDIEENVWVPQLGLKGKIDVSVQVKRHPNNKLNLKSNAIPLELKTGRASFSMEHRGQLILYQMMLTAIGKDTRSGLLLYLREGLMREVFGGHQEQRSLISLRNDMAYYLTREPKLLPTAQEPPKLPNGKLQQALELPEPISHYSACSSCAYNTICCSFAKTDPKLELHSQHPLKKTMAEVTGHLAPEDLEYFMHWCGILTLEEQEGKKFHLLRSLWTDSPEIRRKQGRALIGLVLEGEATFEDSLYLHTFRLGGTQTAEEVDLLLSGFSLGEYVIVSSSKRLAVASGCIYDITKDTISISLERNLQQNYASHTFIVDKHESQSGNIFNYTNLGLLLDDTERASQLRRIIVQRDPPQFSKLPLPSRGKEILRELNAIQRDAVVKALSTKSYMLIKGLPGTGKTQTLTAIIRLLHLMGKTVLITSHTHSAVDNVLLRLKAHNLPMLRLGSKGRVNPQLQEYSEGVLMKGCCTEQELAEKYASFSIVGVTCLGTAHSIFLHQKYDYCIVDEATQVMQSTVLRPLFFCEKFILVGDPEQLPPLIRSKEARSRGADESLFHRLDCEEATSALTMQYRMNKTITKLANDLTYAGELKCGSDSVKMASLKFKLPSEYNAEKWLQRVLQTHVDQAVFLLDTLDCAERSYEFASGNTKNKPCAAIEQTFHEDPECPKALIGSLPKQRKRISKYTNYCDAAIIFHIVKVLLSSGYEADRIGIIAPYRAQVELLRKLAEQHQAHYQSGAGGRQALNFANVEVNTVDQYQGRDKDIILYSCAKTGAPSPQDLARSREAEILEDKRRLTVAITRSKVKLILVGDAKCMQQYSPFRVLLSHIPSYCRLQLLEDKLGFSWPAILGELGHVMAGI